MGRAIRRWALHHSGDKSLHSTLDQLLRQLLPNAVAFNPAEDRSLCHSLDTPQIQAPALQDPKKRATGLIGFAEKIPTLFAHGSSAMKADEHRELRESRGHAQIWECRGVKLLRTAR
jgi:hypothetical protein